MADGDAVARSLVPERLPVKVAVLDAEALPEEIDTTHGPGGHYRTLLALVRRAGRPQGFVLLDVDGPRVTRAELEPALSEMPAASAPASPVAPARAPFASVVVCSTLEREDELRRCLDSLAALEYADYEIVLVDNSRAGAVPAWIAERAHVRVVREGAPGLSAARNLGLAEATGAIVAFTDDDVIADRGWLAALAARFEARPLEACVTGLVLPRDIETPAQALFEQYTGGFGPREMRALSHGLRPRRPFGRATIAQTDDAGALVREFSLYAHGGIGVGANMAFRAAVLRELGGFDVCLGAGTPARAGEDIDVFARLLWRGHRIGFEPAAVVLHRHRHDAAGLCRQIESYGTGFVACTLALVADDPRHLAAELATAPLAARRLGGLFWRRLRHPAPAPADGVDGDGAPACIATLARHELRGMAKGAAAYLASRRRGRRGMAKGAAAFLASRRRRRQR
jgi:GT2 family glycosyltransferase